VVINLGYVLEAHKRTKTIPIVMWLSGFPVEVGVARSLAKPGKNVTGLTSYAGGEVFGKLLALLRDAKPSIKRAGFFMSYVPPFHPRVEADLIIRGIREAAEPLGLDLRVFEISAPEQVDDALAQAAKQGVEALVLTSDAPMHPKRRDIIRFAVANRLPTISDADWGSNHPLLSYAPGYRDLIRGGVDYVDRILWKRAKPGDLPIQLPAKFDLVINARMATTIGLALPRELLVRADKILE
jgi:putative ABC transport system substrate-binding protein